MNKITYVSDQPSDYVKALDGVNSHSELLELLSSYEPIAHDALDLARKFDKKRFDEFLVSLKKERKGIFSKSMDAAIIMMPEIMIKVSMFSEHFKAPWGCAFLRLKEVGKIEEKKGRFYFNEKMGK